MKIARIFFISALVIGVVSTAAAPAFAADYGGGNAQGYASDVPLKDGTIVQLAGENSNKVKVALQSELQNMFGVTVNRNQLPVAVSNADLQNETFVAVSGTYNVLVSTQGGDIENGDYITLSSLSGVGMKAGTEEETVLGRAHSSFNGEGTTLGTTSLKDADGNTDRTVSLGSIPVTIDITRNPNEISTKAEVPEFLERVGQAIAEKEVSAIRIYLSMGITAVSLVAAIAVLYSGVRSGVISIGRNPMSKKSIFRAIFEVILTSALILIIGLFAVYLLLRL